jgi:uncharacterized protein (DUF302 family)
MSYYFSKTLKKSFAQAIQRVTEALAGKGFGVLTIIDVRNDEKEASYRFSSLHYPWGGNPQFAHKARQSEDKIKTMLPCNVVVQEVGKGKVEVSAVDPAASMAAVDNPRLVFIAAEVRGLLKQIVAGL